MRRNLFLTENKEYEYLLAQAARTEPFGYTDNGEKGLYILDGNIVRSFLLSEVERKKQELEPDVKQKKQELEPDSGNFETENL